MNVTINLQWENSHELIFWKFMFNSHPTAQGLFILNTTLFFRIPCFPSKLPYKNNTACTHSNQTKPNFAFSMVLYRFGIVSMKYLRHKNTDNSTKRKQLFEIVFSLYFLFFSPPQNFTTTFSPKPKNPDDGGWSCCFV